MFAFIGWTGRSVWSCLLVLHPWYLFLGEQLGLVVYLPCPVRVTVSPARPPARPLYFGRSAFCHAKRVVGFSFKLAPGRVIDNPRPVTTGVWCDVFLGFLACGQFSGWDCCP